MGPLGNISMKPDLAIILEKSERVIYVTQILLFSASIIRKKNVKSLQKLTIALIRQDLLKISVLFCNRLNFVGVGFKGFPIEVFNTELLQLRLGYSHQIYFRPSSELRISCPSSISLFIWGQSYQTVKQISSIIRSYKLPEPYKGKGILYENETIKIKKGKKV